MIKTDSIFVALLLAGLGATTSLVAEDPLVLELSIEKRPGGPSFRVDGAVEAADGAEIAVALELDDHIVPSGRRSVPLARGRFSAVFNTAGARVLPGLYRVRAHLAAPPFGDASADLRIGTVEEEGEVRIECAAFARDASRRLHDLTVGLQQADASGEGETLSGWGDRFLDLRRSLTVALRPGATFAQYNPDWLREIAVHTSLLEILERERAARAPATADESHLRSLYLQQVCDRQAIRCGQAVPAAPPARAVLARWLAELRVVVQELRMPQSDAGWAAERISALAEAPLAEAEALPEFSALGNLRRSAMNRLQHGEDAETCMHAVERLLLDDREAARARLQRPLELLQNSLREAGAPPLAEVERGIEALNGDGGIAYHFPEFLPRARSAVRALSEASRCTGPDASRTPADKLTERREYCRRTSAALVQRLTALLRR